MFSQITSAICRAGWLEGVPAPLRVSAATPQGARRRRFRFQRRRLFIGQRDRRHKESPRVTRYSSAQIPASTNTNPLTGPSPAIRSGLTSRSGSRSGR
jgi:hypothetical protein